MICPYCQNPETKVIDSRDITRGGFAKDTNIKSNVLFETLEGQPQAGMVMELEIIYQHKQDDPEVSG